MYILDNHDTIIGILENDGSAAASYWEDEIEEKLNDAYLTLNFKMDANHETAALIESKVKIVAPDEDGNLIMFQVEECKDVTAQDGTHTKEVYAEHVALELLGKVIRPQTFSGFTAEQYFSSILENTPWQLGIVEWSGTGDVTFDDYTNAIDAILKGREVFGGELRYRVYFNGPQLAGRYLDLVEKRGENRGSQITYGENMSSLTRTESGREIYTALIGVSRSSNSEGGYLTFADYEASDKPLGQDWIGDDDALQRYGIKLPNGDLAHYFGVFTYDGDEELTPKLLLDKTREALKTQSKPAYTYETTAEKLEQMTGIDANEFRLGDTITVQNLDLEPPLLLEARIIESKGPVENKRDRDFVIGEYSDIYSQHQYSILKKLRNTYLRESAKWATTGARVIHSDVAPTDPEAIWIDTSGDVDIVKTLNPDTGMWEKAAPTLADEILYTNGFTLEDLRPAQAGADITSLNTASDAYKLAGTTASVVRDNASNGAQANSKIVKDVGSGTIESTSGSQTKANTAQTKAEWYTSVRTGVNLITNILNLSVPAPYTWEIGDTPDGVPGPLLKKEYVAGGTIDNTNLMFPSIKVDPNKTYLYEIWVKAMDTNCSYWLGRKEYLADQVTENQSGNGPNMVGGRTPTASDVGVWRKHYCIIAPHNAGIADSHTIPDSSLTPDTDHKFYNANTAYIKPKISLTYAPKDTTKGSIMFATKFALNEIASDDAVYDAIVSSANTAEENAKNHADSVAATVEQNAKDYASDASNITLGTLLAERLYGVTISGKKAYLVDLDAGNITSGFLSFNMARGGVLRLGSVEDGNGVLQVLSDTETVIGEINGLTGASFTTVTAGDIVSDSVVKVNTRDFNLYVDPINGDDSNDGSGWSTPLKTLQAAIDKIPKYNEANIEIQAHYSNAKSMYEELVIEGIVGKGEIVINFQTTANTLNGAVSIYRCQHSIVFKKAKFVTAGDGPDYVVAGFGSNRIQLIDCLVYARKSVSYGVFANGSYMRTDTTKVYDASTAGFLSAYGSQFEVHDCDGSGNNRGLWALGPSIIGGSGTAPAGTANTFTSDGGQIASTFTFPSSAPPETPPAPDKTYTWKATSSKSWRDTSGWRSDNNYVYQGEWSGGGNHRGLWFFNSADIRAKLAGLTIKRVRLYMTRLSKGGSSSAQKPTIWMHSYDSPPSGTPLLAASFTPTTSFAWGDPGKWVTLPNNFGTDLQSGARKGIGLYNSNRSPYMLFNGSVTLEIVAGSA
ncbi:phage tail protein [Priestia aryabhattai]|uniref:phage tail spike protein n=1 Tax=Priestia aryabhattai TaxID=412384 RepID=UPI001C8F1768|nr:phage tail spike protein [Priestia aryabhattai]MBY0077981.1 phage tail protein [Priestia aryabhattai]